MKGSSGSSTKYRFSVPKIKKIKIMKLLYDDKYPYFPGLPDRYRLATNNDFSENGKPIMNLPYLLHSEVDPGKYWALRTKLGFREYHDFNLFLSKKRVFVLK